MKSGAEKFFRENKKDKLESVSGYGSFLQNTQKIREFLPNFIKSYHIHSIVDIPCGDWNWMQKIDLSATQYLGLDILEEIIDENQKKFEKPNIKFKKFDILQEVPPQADLLICRDLLFHFSLINQELAAANIKKSKPCYVLTTTFPFVQKNCELTESELLENWGYREINVELPPINLVNPIAEIIERRATMRVYHLGY